MSNNTKRSAKLYEHLSNAQRAALAMQSMAAMDGDEIALIYAATPRRVYRMADGDFLRRCEGFFHMALIAGAMHWKRYTIYLARVLAVRGAENPLELMPDADDAFEQLAAVGAALEDVCAAHGLDVEAMRVLADMPASKERESLEPDNRHRAKVRADLMECLSF